jgi:predicted Zn-ribbon and HTH transcriptional regulator
MSGVCRAAHAAPTARPRWEVADVFRLHGGAYRRAHRLSPLDREVMSAIERCRTAALGGHLERCDTCGFERVAYNSCRNRHCPKCQSLAKARWLEARRAELLPVPYFHLVFSLLHELNPLAHDNNEVLYSLLFHAAADTLKDFARDPNHLGGKTGFTAILHTWNQQLGYHVHLHCLVPGGALSPDAARWIPARPNYLFPVKALSRVFRGKFIDGLHKAAASGQLSLPGGPEALRTLIATLWSTEWVVYCKPPFAGPEKVLDYLGRYTHRVAISNHRIVDLHDGRVTFRYRDRRDGDTVKLATVSAEEFIRRFLLHVLPKGFQRIRHYGFLAGRAKGRDLPRCRHLLGLTPELPEPEAKTTRQLVLELTGLDLSTCPRCKRGTMEFAGDLPDLSIPCFAVSRSPP